MILTFCPKILFVIYTLYFKDMALLFKMVDDELLSVCYALYLIQFVRSLKVTLWWLGALLLCLYTVVLILSSFNNLVRIIFH